MSDPFAPTPGGAHLDDLAAMLLADGEVVAPATAAHAAACEVCGARVAAFRAEAATLSASLALDEDELAFLLRAQVPQAVATLVSGAAAPPVARDSPASLLAMLALAAAGYAGWLLAQPLVDGVIEAGRRAGLTSLAAQALAAWFIAAAQVVWAAVEAGQGWLVVDSPHLPMLALALVAWVAVWLTSRPARQTEPA